MARRSVADQKGAEPAVDALVHRPSRAKRNRAWEKSQRDKKDVVTYRGVPASLGKQITRIAGDLGVPAGDVARSFLEYGLQAYQAGDLELKPKLAVGRFTLHPPESG
jgi:hypothetical protein